jgi:hypothetical protein
VPDWSSFSFAYGPVVAVLLIGLFALILRWAFGRGGSVVAAPARPGTQDEYGLLVSVAAPLTYIEAEILRRRLAAEGLRVTVATTTSGPHLMVWPADEERARILLLS